MRGLGFGLLLFFYGVVNADQVTAFDSQRIVQTHHMSALEAMSFFAAQGAVLAEPLYEPLGLYLVHFSNRQTPFIDSLAKNPTVKTIKKNEKLRPRSLTNDLFFKKQWQFQVESPYHIQLKPFWDIAAKGIDSRNRKLVVAVVDLGFELSHPDLNHSYWINQNEIPDNFIDDDLNGYVDDHYGWNATLGSGLITSHTHGTSVAGILTATANNSKGIAGMAPEAKVMPIVVSELIESEIIKAYGYIIDQKMHFLKSGGRYGANILVTNSSFGLDNKDCRSQEFKYWNDLYNRMGEVGILSVVAAPNFNIDMDKVGDVPGTCESDYLVTVTSIDFNGKREIGAAFGKNSVDIGAPGANIFSTVAGQGYNSFSGTSYAAPHVSGALALMMSAVGSEFWVKYEEQPSQQILKVKNWLLQTATPSADLKNTTSSGGMLTLQNSLKYLENDF